MYRFSSLFWVWCTRLLTNPEQTLETSTFVTGNMLSLGWSFTTPGSVTGMRGSCVIIPCLFSYTNSQPAGLRVAWYSIQGNGYLPVYDERQNVISTFSKMTSVIGSVGEGNCSLKIEKLQMSHNQERLYPWVDKNPITSYHTVGQRLYDKTTQLIVVGRCLKRPMTIFMTFHYYIH